jgi:four helix bundle protein
MVSPQHFDHEKLDVYQLELKFLTWVTQFLADISGPSLAQTRELREQLDRASLAALLNTAEGNGRRQGRQRAKFFDDARGSAIECAACLDASVAKGFAFSERIQSGKEMLVRIVAMLTKLVDLPNWSSASILSNTGCARAHQSKLRHARTRTNENPRKRTT